MNRIPALLFGILLLINFACQKEIKKTSISSQQKDKKNLVVIKPENKILSFEKIRDVIKKNENFENLIKSFQVNTFTLDELSELTEKDLKYVRQLHQKAFKGKTDTAAISSRLILTEINLKKLDFLLHKQKPQTDTIKKTVDAIISNLNSVIQQVKLYAQSDDEFENILKRDSLININKDSSGIIQKPVMNNRNRPKNKVSGLKLPKELELKKQ